MLDTEPVGCADDSAQIAGVLYVIEHKCELSRYMVNGGQAHLSLLEDGYLRLRCRHRRELFPLRIAQLTLIGSEDRSERAFQLFYTSLAFSHEKRQEVAVLLELKRAYEFGLVLANHKRK